MSAILEPQHLCPKCGDIHSLSAFKLRSRTQGRSPSWCKPCRNGQDRRRRARQRERDVNEYLRRIRFSSPPARVEALFVSAARRAGGIDVVSQRIAERIRSPHIRTALSAVTLLLKLVCAGDRRAVRQ